MAGGRPGPPGDPVCSPWVDPAGPPGDPVCSPWVDPAGGRVADDRGGIWIVTGWTVGLLVYAGVVLMAAAGFTAVLPLVVVPPVLLGLIGAGNLLGGRTHGRTHSRAPHSPSASGGSAPAQGSGATGAAEESGPPP
jgi:hypothetical protein